MTLAIYIYGGFFARGNETYSILYLYTFVYSVFRRFLRARVQIRIYLNAAAFTLVNVFLVDSIRGEFTWKKSFFLNYVYIKD